MAHKRYLRPTVTFWNDDTNEHIKISRLGIRLTAFMIDRLVRIYHIVSSALYTLVDQ